MDNETRIKQMTDKIKKTQSEYDSHWNECLDLQKDIRMLESELKLFVKVKRRVER